MTKLRLLRLYTLLINKISGCNKRTRNQTNQHPEPPPMTEHTPHTSGHLAHLWHPSGSRHHEHPTPSTRHPAPPPMTGHTSHTWQSSHTLHPSGSRHHEHPDTRSPHDRRRRSRKVDKKRGRVDDPSEAGGIFATGAPQGRGGRLQCGGESRMSEGRFFRYVGSDYQKVTNDFGRPPAPRSRPIIRISDKSCTLL